MKKICVNASIDYDVLVGKDLLCNAGRYTSELISPCKVCLVSDSAVQALYGDSLSESFDSAGFEVFMFEFSGGEASKSLDTVSAILERMAEENFTRSDIIVALGGGITGDVAGFAASVFLRGINFIQIPTTFLAAVDSSVGGKTGVNLKSGKNLAGAFWQPSLVLCDYNTFDTLPYEVFADGIAEAIKYGAIFDKSLFDLISAYGCQLFSPVSEDISCQTTQDHSEVLLEIIQRCIQIKSYVVSKDERDTGVRQLLNFGHTLAHAIEKCSDYHITHGHAVAMGMLIVCRASYALGYSEDDCSGEMLEILNKFKFPLECGFSAHDLAEVALKDKKRSGDFITLVLPKKLGNCVLSKIHVSLLEAFIKEGLRS